MIERRLRQAVRSDPQDFPSDLITSPFSWGKNVGFRLPDIHSPTLTERFLCVVRDVDLGTAHMDVFIDSSVLAKTQIIPKNIFSPDKEEISRRTVSFMKRRKANPQMLTSILYSNLKAIYETALAGSMSSREAFDFFAEMLRSRKRIAFVAAHGGTDSRAADPTEWRIFNLNSKISVPVLSVVADLAERKNADGQNHYGLVYLNACNESKASPEIQPSVPVILHTEIHQDALFGSDASAPVKLFRKK